MPAKRRLRPAARLLALLMLAAASLVLATETEPVEYQPGVDIANLLDEAQPAATANGGSGSGGGSNSGSSAHFANAASAIDVRAGLQIYKAQCSSCHGRQLQGQALWQALDPYTGLRAPPHDDSGHTWQHSDENLFRKVRTGRMSEPPEGVAGAADAERHAFRSVLSDADILQVLAFIKARWPLGIRVAQSMLNPQFQGMPPDAGSVEWTFPPTCLSSK